LTRITSGGLTLDYQVGRNLLILVGGFRPLIGAVFGATLFFLVAGNLLPIAVPQDSWQQLYFYCGLAFIAGFSERMAQDRLDITEHRFMPKGARKPSAEISNSTGQEPNHAGPQPTG
jgi:hypothetical protein